MKFGITSAHHGAGIGVGTLGLTVAVTFAALSAFTDVTHFGLAGTFAAGALMGLRNRFSALLALSAFAAISYWRGDNGFILANVGPLVQVSTLLLTIWLPARIRPRLPLWLGSLVIMAACYDLIASQSFSDAIRSWLAPANHLLAVLFGVFFGQQFASRSRWETAWSKAEFIELSRDLLLGRITTGLIHDLAQPINVVAMANNNLSYLIDQMRADDPLRKHMIERVSRITEQTEKAGHLLQYFRNFGRHTAELTDDLTVRNVLERAWVTTRSNIRHAGITTEFRGDALDSVIPASHGYLQIMVAAALLGAYSSFPLNSDNQMKGIVVIQARLHSNQIKIAVFCADPVENARIACRFDAVSLALMEELAETVGCQFTAVHRRGQPDHFSIAVTRFA